MLLKEVKLKSAFSLLGRTLLFYLMQNSYVLRIDLNFKIRFIYFTCLSLSCACVYVHHVYACCLHRSGKGVGSSGTGVLDGCEPLCRCQEPNPGLPQEQQALSTAVPTLQPVTLPLLKRCSTPLCIASLTDVQDLAGTIVIPNHLCGSNLYWP